MAKILIIEDEPKIQQIIQAYLEKEGYQVIKAADGMEGLKAATTLNPDLIILDLMLPKLSGEELLSRLRQTQETPVIILSAKTSEDERIFGLNIGADDYISKPFSPRELLARVAAHLRRNAIVGKGETTTSNVLSFNNGLLKVNEAQHEISVNDKPINLTPTEYKLLLTLCKVPNQVFSRAQLVERIQGYSYDGYDRTIDSHIKNLRQKIEPSLDEPTFIITVFGVGYKFGGELNE